HVVDHAVIEPHRAAGLAEVGGLLPDAQQVAAPQLRDLRVVETTSTQAGGDVGGLGSVHPPGDATSAVEVRRNPDVVEPRNIHHVLDVVQIVFQRGDRLLLLNP